MSIAVSMFTSDRLTVEASHFDKVTRMYLKIEALKIPNLN